MSEASRRFGGIVDKLADSKRSCATEEFVAAGDFLSYKFPTWSWSSGEGSKTRDFLPKDKQYLISKGIPCLRRVSQMEQGAIGGRNRKKSSSKGAKVTADEKLLSFAEGSNGAEGTGGEDDWLATHIDDQGDRMDRAEVGDIDDIPDGEGEGEGDAGAPPSVRMSAGEVDDLASQVAGTGIAHGQSQDGAEDGNDGEVGDIPDMDDEDEDELGAMAGAGVVEQEDPTSVAPAAPSVTTNETATPDNSTRNNILSVRTYDCLITYDKYYQTPRMWLVGYDEHGQPLKPSQIFEDVSSDYAQKTVTIEPFPHSKEGWSTASIHPCKHASVMRKVIERMDRGVKEEQRKLKQQQQQQTLSPQEQGGTSAPGEDDPTTEPTSTTTTEAKSAKKKKWGLGGAMKKVAASRSTSHGNAQQQQGGDGASGSATMTRHTSGPMAGQEEAGEVSTSSASAAEAEEGLRVDQYLLVFLKFMASIVPAIEIDATQSF